MAGVLVDSQMILVVVIIVVAPAFDFLNGFHDAANSIATVVSTAETGGGVAIVFLSLLGIPLSTTHTITGAIVGAGSIQRTSAVRWGIARNIVWAWILTIPCAAMIGAVLESIALPFLSK